MSQPNKEYGDPLLLQRFAEIKRRVYKVPAFVELPSTHQYRPRAVCLRDGAWKSYWDRKPRSHQGTSEPGSGSRGSDSGIDDSFSDPSDDLKTTEEHPEEAEDEVMSLQPGPTDLKKWAVQQPKERECTIYPSYHMRRSHKLDVRGVPRDSAARRSGNRRSRHHQSSTFIHPGRYATYYEKSGQAQEPRPAGPTAGPRPSHASSRVQHARAYDRVQEMRPLPLFQSPSSRTSLPVENRQLSQASNEDGKPHGTHDVSATSDGKSGFNDSDNRAETQSASVPSGVDLDIRISYKDSSEGTQTRDDPYATSSEPLTDYVLANEEDYLARDGSESPCANSLEPLAEYVLASEDDNLAKDHSDCEDDV